MSTLIRNTTTLECGIDRRVDRAGHGEHGGWSLSQGTTIICFCGEPLLELADLKEVRTEYGRKGPRARDLAGLVSRCGGAGRGRWWPRRSRRPVAEADHGPDR